jgi:hypothetical protein
MQTRHLEDRATQLQHGLLTATILKARWIAKYPDGGEYDPLDPVDAVHGEWADMPPEALKAQLEILAAIEQSKWSDADWGAYRARCQAVKQAKVRMKLEAANRTKSNLENGL